MSAVYIAHIDEAQFANRLAHNLVDVGLHAAASDPEARTQHVWQADTFQALKQSRYVLACLTAPALENGWFQRQLKTAREQSKIIFRLQTAALDDTLLQQSEMPWLSEYPLIDFSTGYEAGFNQLVDHLLPYRTRRNFDHPAWDTIPNPYRGLHHFRQWDAPVYTGREDDTRRALQTLRESDFLAIVGASGSGKSSLVQAGISAQVRQGVLDTPEAWTISIVQPGTRPMAALWHSLAGFGDAALTAVPSPKSPVEMLEIVEQLLVDKRWLLVIDPLEHVFSHAGETERDQFLDVLRVFATRSTRTKVVVTLRSEFFSGLKAYPEVADLFNDEQMLTLTEMAPDALRRAVESPAQAVGLRYDSGLVDTILTDFAEQDATLPRLQYLLYQLFLARDDNRLTAVAYQQAGGLNVLAQQAEACYQALTPQQQPVTINALLNLVNITQHALLSHHLVLDDDLFAAVQPFIQPESHLLSQLGSTQPPILRYSHPAVITSWARLAQQVEAVREHLVYESDLRRAQQNWYANNTDPAYLLHGSGLQNAEAWLREYDNAAVSLRQFITASRREADEREASLRQIRRQQRLMQTLRRTMIGIFLLLVIAALFGMIAMLANAI